jgi:hypothetical protein
VDTKHLGQKQLAARWGISEASLERWRSEGIGPKFLKLPGRVFNRQVDIEAFEESRLSTSTKTLAGPLSSNENVAFHRHFCISADVLDWTQLLK